MPRNDSAKKPTRAPEPKGDSRERILVAAAELIAERKEGVAELTVKEVAEKAGVTGPLVHAYYGQERSLGVRGLIVATIYRKFLAHTHDLMELNLWFHRNDRPTKQLVAVLQATVKAFARMPAFGKVVLKEVKELDRNREEIQPIFKIFETVDRIITLGQEQGEIRKLEVAVIRQVLFGVTQSLLSYNYLGAGRPVGVEPLSDDDIESLVLSVLGLFSTGTDSAKPAAAGSLGR